MTAWTPAWNAYAYEVSLLALTRRALKLGEVLFAEQIGRDPTRVEGAIA